MGTGGVWERLVAMVVLKGQAGKIPLLWADSLSLTPPPKSFLHYLVEEELIWCRNKLKAKYLTQSLSLTTSSHLSFYMPHVCAFLHCFRCSPTVMNRLKHVMTTFLSHLPVCVRTQNELCLEGGFQDQFTKVWFTVVITDLDHRGWVAVCESTFWFQLAKARTWLKFCRKMGNSPTREVRESCV